MIDFPSSPTVGQIFTASGVNWTWDGFKWTAGGLNVGYLPMTGGTLTGPLTLAADPVAPLQAATMQYVDGRFSYPSGNRIINGDMRIDQRNNGASGTANGYTIDRWYAQSAPASKFVWGRNLNALPSLSATGFAYYLGVQSSSAYAAAAGDTFQLFQPIEADAIGDFAWGGPNAQPVTLSFWAYSSLSGTFSGSIRNYAATRSYPFSYPLTAGVWAKVVIAVPGDTANAQWVMSGNAGSMFVTFDLGSGSSARGPANVWATTTSPGYIGAIGAASVVSANAAYFYVTGVKLEIGSVATPFNRQSLAKSMADCQRYYEAVNPPDYMLAYASAAGVQTVGSIHFVATKRAAATVTITWVSGGYTAPTIVTATGDVATVSATAPAIGSQFLNYSYTASAEL